MKKGDLVKVYGHMFGPDEREIEYFGYGTRAKVVNVWSEECIDVRILKKNSDHRPEVRGLIASVHVKQCRKIKRKK